MVDATTQFTKKEVCGMNKMRFLNVNITICPVSGEKAVPCAFYA